MGLGTGEAARRALEAVIGNTKNTLSGSKADEESQNFPPAAGSKGTTSKFLFYGCPSIIITDGFILTGVLCVSVQNKSNTSLHERDFPSY